MSTPEPKAPDPVSPSAAPSLTADELEKRIEKRQREMETNPCYRCDHSPAKPDPGCPCCADAHTPDGAGDFTTATAVEFEKGKKGARSK